MASSSKIRSWASTILVAYLLFLLSHTLYFESTPSDTRSLLSLTLFLDSIGTVDLGANRVQSTHILLLLRGYQQRFIIALPGRSDIPQLLDADSVTILVSAEVWKNRNVKDDIFVYGLLLNGDEIISAQEVLDTLNDRFPFHPVMVLAVITSLLILIFTRKRTSLPSTH
jgi:hypothetical protein